MPSPSRTRPSYPQTLSSGSATVQLCRALKSERGFTRTSAQAQLDRQPSHTLDLYWAKQKTKVTQSDASPRPGLGRQEVC